MLSFSVSLARAWLYSCTTTISITKQCHYSLNLQMLVWLFSCWGCPVQTAGSLNRLSSAGIWLHLRVQSPTYICLLIHSSDCSPRIIIACLCLMNFLRGANVTNDSVSSQLVVLWSLKWTDMSLSPMTRLPDRNLQPGTKSQGSFSRGGLLISKEKWLFHG